MVPSDTLSLSSLSLSEPDLVVAFAPSLALLASLFNKLSLPYPPSASPPLPIQDVRNDFIALATHLGKEATALALAFKPPASVAAAVAIAQNVHELLQKLQFCTENAPRTGALGKEIHWLALEFLEAYQRLLLALSAYATSIAVKSKAKDEREHILRLTAQVWTSVEAAKSCSPDELQAARKGWQSIRSLLDDCLDELGVIPDDPDEEPPDPRRPSVLLLLRLTRLLLHRLITLASTIAFSPAFLPPAEALIAELSPLADELEDGETDELVEVATKLAALVEAEAGDGERKWFDMWRLQIGKVVERLKQDEVQ